MPIAAARIWLHRGFHQLELGAGNYKLAAQTFSHAAIDCMGQHDNWFPPREIAARCAAARAYLKAGDAAAGFAVMEPLTARLKAGEDLREEVRLTLGSLYEGSGQSDQALKLYRPGAQPRRRGSSVAADRFNRLMRERDKTNGQGSSLVEYQIVQKHSGRCLCAGDDRIWLGGSSLQWYVPASGLAGSVRNPAGGDVRRLAWAAPFLWVGTSRDGLWRLDTRGADEQPRKDHWTQIEGMPDQQITALTPGDRGDMFAGVGVDAPDQGVGVRGSVVRVAADGHVYPLGGTNAPQTAPDRLLWQRGMLWAMSHDGVVRWDARKARWDTFSRQTFRIAAGIDRILIASQPTDGRGAVTTGWVAADVPAATLTPQNLGAGTFEFALETPACLWLGARGPGVQETHELRCMDKRSGATITLNEQAGQPFTWVHDALWFQDHLWLATYAGLVRIDAVHFPEPAPAPVRLAVAPTKEKVFPFGKVVETSFAVTNKSDRAIVVTRIGDEKLSSSVYGSITKDPSKETYLHAEMVQQASAEALHRGFLLPNESMEFTRPWRPEDPTEKIAIEYLIAEDAYQATAASLAPFAVYVADAPTNGMSTTYIPFTPDAWRKASTTAAATNRSVIIPHIDIARGAEKLTMPIAVTFDQPGFTRDAAQAAVVRIAGQARPVAYSEALGGYLVIEKDHTWLLRDATQPAAGPHLALCPPTLVFDADKDGTIQVRISEEQPAGTPSPDRKPTGEKYWNQYPIQWGDGMYTRGQFIHVDKKDLGGFLARTGTEGYVLERLNYFFESHYFVLRKAGER